MATVRPMAVIPTNERAAVTASIMRDPLCPGTVTKAQLRAAVDAADQWADDNAAAFNTALPAAFRNNATAKEKALLLMYVISKRNDLA